MQNAGSDVRYSDVRLKICLTDTIGAPATLERLRRFAASLGATEGDVSAFPDLALVLVDAASGFSPQARQAVAIARTAGARHVVLAFDADKPAAAALKDALADFAAKLEFKSAEVVSIGSASQADDLNAELGVHLVKVASTLRQVQPRVSVLRSSGQFAAHIASLSEQELLPGREYRLRLADQVATASATAVKYRLDLDTLRRIPARTLSRGEIGACTIATDVPLSLGETQDGQQARFTLSDLFTDEVVAAGSVDFALRRGMNVHWQPFTVTKELRAAANDQRPCIIWFTGLSGSGKSTIANLVEGWLALQGRRTYLLDGDNVRHGLNKDLGFTAADRVENIRRVGEVARLFVDAGLIVMCSFISPFRAERLSVRSLVAADEFIEIHVTAPLEVCEQRDPKGLYAKCRAGNLPNFTGIDSPYEAPEQPDLVLDTTTASPGELAQRVIALLHARGVVSAPEEHAQVMRGRQTV